MKWFHMITAVIVLLLAALLLTMFSACTDTRTTVSPGVVTTHDNQTRTPTHTLHLKITPTTQPANLPGVPATITSPTSHDLQLPNGQLIPIPPGAAVELDYADNASTTRSRDATSTGAGFTSDKDLTAQIASKPDMVNLAPVTDGGDSGGGSSASDGGSSFGWKPFINAVSAASSTAHWMMGVGALILIVGWGIATFMSWQFSKIEWTLYALVAVLGFGVLGSAIILDTHPMVIVLVLVVGLGALAWYAYHRIATSPTATTPAGATTPIPGAITTAESDAKAAAAKVEGLITGLFHKSTVAPTAPAPDPNAAAVAQVQKIVGVTTTPSN